MTLSQQRQEQGNCTSNKDDDELHADNDNNNCNNKQRNSIIHKMFHIIYWPFQTILKSFDCYFYQPISIKSLRMTGYLRVFLALIYLFDQFIWTYDRQWLLSPTNGIISYELSLKRHSNKHSLLHLFPNNELYFWSLHYTGILCGVLLLFGIMSKLSLFICYVIQLSFQHSSLNFGMDMQDDMLRVWMFYFLFFPLDNVTIYDWIPNYRRESDDKTSNKRTDIVIGNQLDTTSTPTTITTQCYSIWPYRLIQLQLVFIYMGAAYGKLLVSDAWMLGLEIWRSLHAHIFCQSGLFQPQWLLNTLMPLKLLTWSALLLENLSIILIWPIRTRKIIVYTMIIFHIGIDLTMNMHIFEYVSILGWFFFLIETADENADKTITTTTTRQTTMTTTKKKVQSLLTSRWITTPLITVLIVTAWAQSNPGYLWEDVVPEGPILETVQTYNTIAKRITKHTKPYTYHIGFYQSAWLIFCGGGLEPGFRWYANIDYTFQKNETIETVHVNDVKSIRWSSPNWQTMTWYEQKRHHRNMLFYEEALISNLDTPVGVTALYRFSEKLYHNFHQKYGLSYHNTNSSIIPGEIISPTDIETNNEQNIEWNILSISLEVELSEGPWFPPNDLGSWEIPAVRPETITRTVYDAFYFTPYASDKAEREICQRKAKPLNGCERYPRFMYTNCLQTCIQKGHYNFALQVYKGSRIVYGPREQNYVVIEKYNDGYFLIENESTGQQSVVDLHSQDFGMIKDSPGSDGVNESEDDVTVTEEVHPGSVNDEMSKNEL